MKLAQVRRFALSLPEAVEGPHFNYTSFRVRGKIFATVPPEETHLHVFVDDEEREIVLAREARSAQNLMWGGKVVGLRVKLSKARPSVVTDLLRAAWLRRAPKTLVARVAFAPAGVRAKRAKTDP